MNQLSQVMPQSMPFAPSGDSAAAEGFHEHAPTRGTLLLLDNRPLRRAGLERLLEEWAAGEGISVVAHGDVSSAQLEELRDIRLVLLSIGSDVIPTKIIQDISNRIRNCLVVLLSDRDGKADVIAALQAGARGYMTSYTNPVLMLHALKFILGGGVFFPPEALQASDDLVVATAASQKPSSPAMSDGAVMTPRQERVLEHIRQGMSNKEIGRALGMCEATVKVHVRQIMRKLRATNRTQVALLAHAMNTAKGELDLIATTAEPERPTCVP